MNAAKDPLPVAVLLSGSGRTLQNLADLAAAGDLPIRITTVVASRAEVFGLERARRLGLSAHVVDRHQCASAQDFSARIFDLVRQSGAQFVCLAGFLSLLVIPEDYAQAVVNIHPALLPAFGGHGMYGHHVHEAVLAAGCKVSGCTVHFADPAYDTGAIIVQRTCPVLEDDDADTLAGRVFEQETLAYPEAWRLIGQGRVIHAGRRARIAPPAGGDLPRDAREFCRFAHHGQIRDDGSPYAGHPIAVADLVARHSDDPVTQAAAYLHDVLEDTPVKAWQLRRAFGEAVTRLVEELTNPAVPGRDFEQKHTILNQHARHMTPQARLIKLADRCHNLEQMHAWEPERQARYARVTVDLLEALKPWPAPALAERIQQHVARFPR